MTRRIRATFARIATTRREVRRTAGSQYRLQSACLLVVEERLHGKRKGETEVPLKGVATKVIAYIDGSGFGLKGEAPGGPSSLDLFDSKSEATAAKAGELIAQLAARCA